MLCTTEQSGPPLIGFGMGSDIIDEIHRDQVVRSFSARSEDQKNYCKNRKMTPRLIK